MYIIRAAIMYPNRETIEAQSYRQIASFATKIGFIGGGVEGFTTSTGDFVLPELAAKIAMESGQLDSYRDYLTPEDLWPI